MKRISTILFLLVLVACGGGGGSGGSGDGSSLPVSGLPGSIQLGSTSYDVAEGAVVNILVTRSGGSSGVVSVDYATADGTAIAGTDYPAMSGTLTYADGVSGNQTISIPISEDNTAEIAEAFTVTLSNVSRATLGANTIATVNIINDSAALPITDGNAQDITVAVLEAVISTVDASNILEIIGLPVGDVAGTNPGLAKVLAADFSAGIIACDSGEATVTWNDADNNLAISTGDTFDVIFSMCFFADAETTFDGPVSLTDLVVTGDPFNQIAPWGLALTIGFDNLSGTDGTGTAIIDGGLDLEWSSQDNLVVNLSIATASLTAQQSGISETLSDYVLAQTVDLNALTIVVGANGTFTSTLLEGNVIFETLQDFTSIGLDDNPSEGQLLISDSSSSVLITVIDNINVQLEIDIDRDGTIDRTIVVTWAELDID